MPRFLARELGSLTRIELYRMDKVGWLVFTARSSYAIAVLHGDWGVTTAPADPAMQGAADPGGPSRLPENILLTVRPCSISGVYGFALFDECVDPDALDRARFARNVLDFLVTVTHVSSSNVSKQNNFARGPCTFLPGEPQN